MSEEMLKQITSNNLNVSDLHSRWARGLLTLSPDFQRKLVWKKVHKLKLIDTVLKNFPFPEVYIANGDTRQIDSIPQQISLVVDGQQRLTTIFNYIDGKDIFFEENKGIPKFSSLPPSTKSKFMSYKISVRDLEIISKELMIEVFDRINQSSYTLNSVEKLNAQYLDSEFLLYCKQLVEAEERFIPFNLVRFRIPEDQRLFINNFFQKKCSIFSDVDNDRYFSLQYMMTLVGTLVVGKYFGRNAGAEKCLIDFNEEFPNAIQITGIIYEVANLLDFITEFDQDSIWNTKSNVFSLVVELSNYDLTQIKIEEFKKIMFEVSIQHKLFLSGNSKFPSSLIEFFECSREGVNQQNRREIRGSFIRNLINSSLIK